MKLHSLKETKKLSMKIGRIIGSGDFLFIYGEIGTGKTTFVRFLINSLEIKNKLTRSQVLSPTFNIVYDYRIKKLKILHYDLYRIDNEKDINELGIFHETENHLTIIEWPELIKNKPKNRIEVFLKYVGDLDIRSVKINGFGKWKNYKKLVND